MLQTWLRPFSALINLFWYKWSYLYLKTEFLYKFFLLNWVYSYKKLHVSKNNRALYQICMILQLTLIKSILRQYAREEHLGRSGNQTRDHLISKQPTWYYLYYSSDWEKPPRVLEIISLSFREILRSIYYFYPWTFNFYP